MESLLVRGFGRARARRGAQRHEPGQLGADVAGAVVGWHVQKTIRRQNAEVAAPAHPVVGRHLARVRIQELDAGPACDHPVADDLHLMAAVMLEAVPVFPLDAHLDLAGKRIIRVDVEIIGGGAPHIHPRVRPPEMFLEAEEIDGG